MKDAQVIVRVDARLIIKSHANLRTGRELVHEARGNELRRCRGFMPGKVQRQPVVAHRHIISNCLHPSLALKKEIRVSTMLIFQRKFPLHFAGPACE